MATQINEWYIHARKIYTQKLIETLTWSVIESRRLLFSTQLRRSQFAVKHLGIVSQHVFAHRLVINFFVAIFLYFARIGRMRNILASFILLRRHGIAEKSTSFDFQIKFSGIRTTPKMNEKLSLEQNSLQTSETCIQPPSSAVMGAHTRIRYVSTWLNVRSTYIFFLSYECGMKNE